MHRPAHPRSTRTAFAFAAAAVAGGVAPVRAQPATFRGLGQFPGSSSHWSSAADVSFDGSTAIGFATTGEGSRCFRWTAAAGLEGFDDPDFSVSAVSGNGSVIVGRVPGPHGEAARWTIASGVVPQGLAHAGYTTSSAASAVSLDGQIAAGDAAKQTNTQCPFWNSWYYLHQYRAYVQNEPGAPLDVLGPLAGYNSSSASAISGDGSIVAGNSIRNTSCNEWASQACLWTGGEHPIGLGALAPQTNSSALAISAEGSTVVGYSGPHAFRWDASTGMMDLGEPPGFTSDNRVAWDVSANGSVIVGYCQAQNANAAFIWDESRGMRLLRDVLENDLGVNLPGWQLYAARGVSGDGRTIVGWGTNPTGQTEGWIAFLGDAVCYPDCNADGALTVADFGCFQTEFVTGDPHADCNGDGLLTVADFGCFQTSFVSGCP